MYNLTEEIFSTVTINLNSVPQQTGDIPGLTKTLILTKPSKVIVSYTVYALSVGCSFCSSTIFNMEIFLNNISTGRIRKTLVNASWDPVVGNRILTLAAGTHTIKIVGKNLSGPTLRLGSDSYTDYPSSMIIQVIPQN